MTLGKDIAADASQKAANQVRPSEEELSQIDQAAEENVWHEKPNVSKDDLKSKFKKNKDVCTPRMGPQFPHTDIIFRRREAPLPLPLRLPRKRPACRRRTRRGNIPRRPRSTCPRRFPRSVASRPSGASRR